MEKTDVIVIGAGPAGVTAAHTIGGLLDTIVLEARPDRIGGRAYSSRVLPHEEGQLWAPALAHAGHKPPTAGHPGEGIQKRRSAVAQIPLRAAHHHTFSRGT